jgi:GTPase SAR1 family protein
MSSVDTPHPQAIIQLAKRLDISANAFINESRVGRRGFFRYGRRNHDACRYCLEDGQIIGLSLRSQNVNDLGWLDDEAFILLEDLYFGENTFTNLIIPSSWTKLRRVDLSNSPRLRSVSFAGAADQLERLEITDSSLTRLTLPATGCPNLQFLDFSRSEIKELIINGPCSSLHSLHLRDAAHLETLKINTLLPSLDTLELIGCEKLKELPVQVISKSPLERLYLDGCTPKNCPSYLCTNSGLEGAKVWFQELAKGHDVNKRVKLLISGNGDVGKSTIQCALANKNMLRCNCDEDHETTHGILIGVIEHDDIIFSYWDFGGQDVYGATHQLFFADEAVQLLVFDPRYEGIARAGQESSDRTPAGIEQKHPLEYFHEIQRKKSKHDTFIIVQNKHDKPNNEDSVDYTQADKSLLNYAEQKLNGRFHHVDAKSGYNIDELLKAIVALGKELPRYNMPFPKTWLAVRQWFIDNDEKETEKRKHINRKYFTEGICIPAGVNDAKAQGYLLDYLESAGYCYVIGNSRRTSGLDSGPDIIVDQEWALKAIYRPLDRKKIRSSWIRMQGQVTAEDIFQAFDSTGEEYSEDDKWLFIDFMQDNKLCFSVSSNQDGWGTTSERSQEELFVFPQYLPPQEPPNFTDWTKKTSALLHLRIKTPFVNKATFHAFICKLGRKTELRNLWRHGILVTDDENKNLFAVKMNFAETCYEVFCTKNATDVWLKSLLEEAPDGEHFIEEGGTFVSYEKGYEVSGLIELESKSVLVDIADKVPQHRDHIYYVAVMISHPQGEKEIPVESELGTITARANSGSGGGKFVITPYGVLSEDVLEEVAAGENPEFIHVIGHGTKSGLILHRRSSPLPEVKTIRDLQRIFKDITSQKENRLRVVLLNACYTEDTAKAISTNNLHVIGTEDEIKSNHAKEFSGAFYQFYRSCNADIVEAFKNAKRKAVREGASASDYHLFHNGEKIE